jgi:DDE family transposase/transposase-like protein DUF772
MSENYMAVVLDLERPMTLGLAERQGNLLDDVKRFCDEALSESSVYAVLHRERDRLFPDEMFADLFSDKGRRSVPPSVVATVMVLQRLEGLSDREAVERYTFDARWRYAAGVGGYGGEGWAGFAHTVLVDMRARLAASKNPRRIFTVTVAAASSAGLVGAKRVLDSTPLYDAVATMDTVTLIRSAIRGLLKAAGPELAAEFRAVLQSGDDYASAAKPGIDWSDEDERHALIDSRARDAYAIVGVLEGRVLSPALAEAAELLATVVGQDIEETTDGTFRIARRVTKDRVISTVDPEARHGHKTAARGFDGYKGHVAIDPDSEVITDTVVSAANAGDASVAAELIDDLLAETPEPQGTEYPGVPGVGAPAPKAGRRRGARKAKHDQRVAAARASARRTRERKRTARRAKATAHESTTTSVSDCPTVYGDAAYGAGEFLDRLGQAGIDARCKIQPPTAPGGRFAKDRFDIDLVTDTVTCPAGVTAAVRRGASGDGIAYFAEHCLACPLRARCTDAGGGRTIQVGRYEQRLADARAQQQDPTWAADYRATRPKVERKLGHMMRRRHGGRRARVRGRGKVDADFNLLAAAQNLARLAVLGLHFNAQSGWAVVA